MNEQIIQLFGTISRYWYGKDFFSFYLNKYKGQPVRLQICSYGGEVGEALAISALLENHGNVTVEYIGLNASAATFVSFGAKRIEMREDAMWLCHKCSLPVDFYGHLNADKLEEKIKELQSAKKDAEAIDLLIAKKYADRSGKKIVDVLALMTKANWMSADKVLEWGFVDAVVPSKNKKPNVTENIKNSLEANGLPLPFNEEEETEATEVLTDENKTDEPAGEDDNASEGLVSQIISGIKDFFNANKKQETIINQSVMNKDYKSVNTILNIEGVEVKEGKVTLTEEQLKALNQAIEDAQAAQTTAEDNVNALISDLDELGEGIKNASDGKAKVAAVKAILDRLPGQSTETHNEGEQENKFASIALDPINNYDNE